MPESRDPQTPPQRSEGADPQAVTPAPKVCPNPDCRNGRVPISDGPEGEGDTMPCPNRAFHTPALDEAGGGS